LSVTHINRHAMSKPANSNESPLLDKSILLTRPEGQSEATRLTLESLGASVNAHPVIQILPPKDFTELDDCLDRLDQFDWLVLVSPNAVRFFCQRFGDKFKTFAPLHQKKIATIGSTTLEALKLEAKKADWLADLVPPISNSESLGIELAKSAKGQRLLIPRVDRHSDTLGEILAESGIEFEQPLTYRHATIESANPKIAQELAEGKFDWVTITSPAIANATVELFGNSLLKARLASISPRASKALEPIGHPEIVEAKTPNMEGVIAAIVEFENSKG